MAVATTCPACGKSFPLPAGFAGGSVTCPQATCANVFQVAGGSKAAGNRGKSSRPELLDRLPTSFFASPAMLAIGLAGALLYGMVLFGVLSARKQRASVELAQATNEAPSAPRPAVAEPAPEKSSRPATAEVIAKEPAVEIAKPTPSLEKRSMPEVPVKKTTVTKPSESVKTSPVAPEEGKANRWGRLSGSPEDCSFRADGEGLTIAIPATLHILSPDLKSMNAPRLLTTVSGDFQAQVRVAGKISPGTQPLPSLPFTFQGAGLLIWQDEKNYLRLERTSIYSPEGGKLHQIFVESLRDGKLVPMTAKSTREGDTLLRVDRKGSDIRCSYSPDEGKNWIEVKRQSVGFPNEVQVGVSAANASTKPFSARLEAFQLSGPGVKTGKTP